MFAEASYCPGPLPQEAQRLPTGKSFFGIVRGGKSTPAGESLSGSSALTGWRIILRDHCQRKLNMHRLDNHSPGLLLKESQLQPDNHCPGAFPAESQHLPAGKLSSGTIPGGKSTPVGESLAGTDLGGMSIPVGESYTSGKFLTKSTRRLDV